MKYLKNPHFRPAFSIVELVFAVIFVAVMAAVAFRYFGGSSDAAIKNELNATLSTIAANLGAQLQKCRLMGGACEQADPEQLLKISHASGSFWGVRGGEIVVNRGDLKASFTIKNGVIYCVSGACEAFSAVKRAK